MKSLILSIILCTAISNAWAQEQTVDSIAVTQTAIIDVSAKLKIYPNPSGSWLFVTHPSINKKGQQLLIIDMFGKTVLKAEVKIQTAQSILNMSQLQPGIYFVSWINGNERGIVKVQKN